MTCLQGEYFFIGKACASDSPSSSLLRPLIPKQPSCSRQDLMHKSPDFLEYLGMMLIKHSLTCNTCAFAMSAIQPSRNWRRSQFLVRLPQVRTSGRLGMAEGPACFGSRVSRMVIRSAVDFILAGGPAQSRMQESQDRGGFDACHLRSNRPLRGDTRLPHPRNRSRDIDCLPWETGSANHARRMEANGK
jgi:hypothetical protein